MVQLEVPAQTVGMIQGRRVHNITIGLFEEELYCVHRVPQLEVKLKISIPLLGSILFLLSLSLSPPFPPFLLPSLPPFSVIITLSHQSFHAGTFHIS